MIRNTWPFLRLLLRSPLEFFDRVEVIWQGRKENGICRHGSCAEGIGFAEGLRALSDTLGSDLFSILGEPELQDIQSHIAGLKSALEVRAQLPFPLIYNTDPTVAQLAYLLCRVLEPKTVLETGVAYGVTSAMILAALHRNGKGQLHSIDLPPMADRAHREHIGMMIPGEYKDRWHLHVGPSKRVLPSLLANGIGEVGLFSHDSANTYRVQKMEQEMVWPHMASRAAMIINHIDKKTAFSEFVKEKHVEHWAAIEQTEKPGILTGIILKI